MAQPTQVHEIFNERIAVLHGRRDSMRLRWRVWTEQIAHGDVPCFATEFRNVCHESDCAWRPQCLALKAEWKR